MRVAGEPRFCVGVQGRDACQADSPRRRRPLRRPSGVTRTAAAAAAAARTWTETRTATEAERPWFWAKKPGRGVAAMRPQRGRRDGAAAVATAAAFITAPAAAAPAAVQFCCRRWVSRTPSGLLRGSVGEWGCKIFPALGLAERRCSTTRGGWRGVAAFRRPGYQTPPRCLSSRFGKRYLDLDASCVSSRFVCCMRRDSGFEKSSNSRLYFALGARAL